MNQIKIIPEIKLKSFWILMWGIWFAVGFIPGVFLMLVLRSPGDFISALSLVCWLIIMGAVILWLPAYYRSLEYIIDDDSVKGKKGVFWRKFVTVPFMKITNIDVTQGPVQRVFGIATVHIQTAGAGGAQGTKAELNIYGISNYENLKNEIMERVKYFTNSKIEKSDKVIEMGDINILNRILEELINVRNELTKK